MAQAQNFYLVTIPLRDDSAATIKDDMHRRVADGNCKLHSFEIPGLVVGTLDSLMALSDDLVKINTQVENTVRKVERQYEEMTRDVKDKPPLTVGAKVRFFFVFFCFFTFISPLLPPFPIFSCVIYGQYM